MPKENYEWIGRLDTTNCTNILSCTFNANRNNTNLNGWNVNNDVTMETLLAAYNALEKMVELGYNPDRMIKIFQMFQNYKYIEICIQILVQMVLQLQEVLI
ncbi:MAG: hypothetical protein ACYSOW_10405 [Planctomycetota bacterium]|jgi:hypothetical protein